MIYPSGVCAHMLRFDGVSASSITMFDPAVTVIPKTLITPEQSVVSSYAPTEVSESNSDGDNDSRINTARSDLEKVYVCCVPHTYTLYSLHYYLHVWAIFRCSWMKHQSSLWMVTWV